jgi:hypothetical protein
MTEVLGEIWHPRVVIGHVVIVEKVGRIFPKPGSDAAYLVVPSLITPATR